MRTHLLLLICGVLPLLSSCSHTGSASKKEVRDGTFETLPFVGNFEVKRATLPNGLRIIIQKDTSSPTFAYQTWFNVGSRNEVPGKTGLAHLFEHMMFKGTSKYPDGRFDALLEQAGAEGENAFTSNDHTVYIQEMPKEGFDLISELESDRMVNLIVNDASFKTEREVVQNERRFRKENSPEGTMYQTLFETAFTTHPYRWPVIGYEQDLTSMSAQDGRDFYTRFYSPDRAVIVVVGDVDENRVLKRVERLYGDLSARKTENPPYQAEPEQSAQRRKRLELNIEVEKVWLAFKIQGLNSSDTPAFEAIQGLLTEGRNGRLNRALVDAGIATAVGSGSIALRDPSLFLIEADLQKGKTALLAESVILRELERLKNTPVKADELKRATNVMRFRFMSRLLTSHGRAHVLGQFETENGSVEAGLAQQEQVYSVTPEQIQETSKRVFQTAKLTVITGVPKSAATGKDQQ